MGPVLIQLLETSFLLGELVVNLPDVYGLQHRVTVAGVGWANMHKQMLILQEETSKGKKRRETWRKDGPERAQ